MEAHIIKTGYLPRQHQEFLHENIKRFNVLVCHRRFGKSTFAINHILDDGLRNNKRNPQYAFIGPTYGQVKRIIWEVAKDYVKEIPNVTINEAELRIDIRRPHLGDKVRIMLLSGENPGSIKGIYLDGAILDEYAEMDPIVWSQVVRPTLSDRKGWGIFIGTPKGNNHFYDIFQFAETNPKWFSKVFKASETNILPQSELDDCKAEMSEEEYDQEFECSFTAALVGSYYAKQFKKIDEDKRVRNLPHDPSLAVDLYWDLGIGDATAVWFLQQFGHEYRFIDYYEISGAALPEIVNELKRRREKHKYSYREVVLPHDGAARSLDTGRTRQETLRELMGINPIVLPRQAIEDGIHASRMLLAKSYFDEVKCKRGIRALREYEKKWNSKERRFENKPRHNWASHGADAFRVCAMGNRPETSRKKINDLQRFADSDYDVLT